MTGWWPAEGNTADIQFGNQGVAQGSVTYAAGEVGQAFVLNGTSWVRVPASNSVNVGTGTGITIDAWIKPTNVTYAPIAEWNNPASGTPIGVHLWIGGAVASGELYANVVDTTNTFHSFWSATGLILAGSYQHVALTYDKASGMATLYLNGVVVAGPASFGTFTPQTSFDLYLGNRPAGPGQATYSGQMDEVEIFNRALTGAEINAIYSAGSVGKCQGVPALSPVALVLLAAALTAAAFWSISRLTS